MGYEFLLVDRMLTNRAAKKRVNLVGDFCACVLRMLLVEKYVLR